MTKSLKSSTQPHSSNFKPHLFCFLLLLPPPLYTILSLSLLINKSNIFAMFAARRLATRVPRAGVAPFHSTAPAFVQKGDAIPNIDLVENSPGNKVNLAKELSGKGVIVGVPAAFSRSHWN
jgi:hypothetical protein